MRLFILAASLALASFASAHDFWIHPSTFSPAADAPIAFSLEIGHLGESERYARNPARIERFVIVGPGAGGPERNIPGSPGSDPAGMTVMLGEGSYVVGYRSNHARNQLPADKFEHYLREEGLEDIIALRDAAGASAAPGREIYSRCAKSLLRTAGSTSTDGGAEQPLGFTLELVPVGDPTLAKVGERVTFRLLFEGQPYAGAKVEFSTEHGHDDGAAHAHHDSARTAPDGTVSFTVDHEGLWVLNAVVMQEAQNRADADWESWWASATFEVAE
jgi:uncharacterized GH25 family protein